MSAFEALRVLQTQQAIEVQTPLTVLAANIVRINADTTGLDFDAALVLAEIFNSKPEFRNGSVFYQQCIECLILQQQPVWAKIITLGRQMLAQKLSRDEEQCFREAGLLISPPTEQIILWWDRISGQVRLAADQMKLERARVAERLTIEEETRRLHKNGINKIPQWIAIEDNTAGYDVLSYEPGTIEPTNRLIEVKSTVVSPLRFYISRHEWDQACRFGDSYYFHIWDLQAQPPRLFERTVAQIEPHIPSDNELGHWKNAEIPIRNIE